jgi:glycosyltransferase involved in cell wall biosynthesis
VELVAAGVRVHGLHLSRRRTLACAQALAEFFPPSRPLIVHAHLFHANIAVRLAVSRMSRSERATIPVLTTVHVAERRFRPWQFALDRLTARYARAEICVSRAVARFQQEHTRLPPEFFRVIENGIDLSRFEPSAPAGDVPLVVSIGRLDPQKDFLTLLRAWPAVSARFPAAKLAIAGSGPEEGSLRALSASLGLAHVEFLGFVKDVPALLRKATLYAQPSAWEGFGLTVAEAMACALPVVVSDADSLPELVAHDKTGLVVPKGQPSALADAMLALLADPARAAKLGTAARVEALRRFSVERMVADYARLYRELLCVS